MARARTALLAIGFVSWAATAGAQATSANDAAAAEKLFDDGRKLMGQGRFSEACPKLAESQRLDPGVGTQLNLAECYEKNGQTASAWATYRDAETAAARAGQKARAKFAAERAEKLSKSLKYLTVRVSDRARVAGLTIVRDSLELGAATWGTAVPIDPGAHTITASATGYKPWTTTIAVDKSDAAIDVPELQAEPKPKPPPAAGGPKPPEHPIVVVPPPANTGSTQRTIGWVLAGVGVASVGAGGVFAYLAKKSNDDAQPHCSPIDCDGQGVDLTRTAKRQANVATAFIGVGAAAIVGGLVLVFTAPHAPSQPRTTGRWIAPWADAQGEGIAAGGSW